MSDQMRQALEAAGRTSPDADNLFMVGINGYAEVTLFKPPAIGQRLSKSEALALAAWIVTLVNDEAAFAAALAEVQR